jgi:hypothetical protein
MEFQASSYIGFNSLIFVGTVLYLKRLIKTMHAEQTTGSPEPEPDPEPHNNAAPVLP